NLFAPDRPITREELTAILKRRADSASAALPVIREYTGFPDEAKIADYAKDAVEAFFEAGVINGKDNGLFDPTGPATRAEFAAMLRRLNTVDVFLAWEDYLRGEE
ncbi:MAG: S-layer homology domain-containing protein, partial [Clostridiales bacterium]|nr:S-layer homology domain-containing protein [Clostridiales bacterium]